MMHCILLLLTCTTITTRTTVYMYMFRYVWFMWETHYRHVQQTRLTPHLSADCDIFLTMEDMEYILK